VLAGDIDLAHEALEQAESYYEQKGCIICLERLRARATLATH
jgi:hypothetical protein